jgi:hypothetical protein
MEQATTELKTYDILLHTSYLVSSNKFLQLYNTEAKLPKYMSKWKQMFYYRENETKHVRTQGSIFQITQLTYNFCTK